MNPGDRGCSELRLRHCTPAWATQKKKNKKLELKLLMILYIYKIVRKISEGYENMLRYLLGCCLDKSLARLIKDKREHVSKIYYEEKK